jgi:hypothetical protein
MHPSTAEHRAEQAPTHDRDLRSLPAAVTAHAADCESAAPPLLPVGLRVGSTPPNRSFETTPSGDGAIHAVLPTQAALYRWAGVSCRRDGPSVYELVAAGWTPVAHDTRYGSTLCMRNEE